MDPYFPRTSFCPSKPAPNDGLFDVGIHQLQQHTAPRTPKLAVSFWATTICNGKSLILLEAQRLSQTSLQHPAPPSYSPHGRSWRPTVVTHVFVKVFISLMQCSWDFPHAALRIFVPSCHNTGTFRKSADWLSNYTRTISRMKKLLAACMGTLERMHVVLSCDWTNVYSPELLLLFS